MFVSFPINIFLERHESISSLTSSTHGCGINSLVSFLCLMACKPFVGYFNAKAILVEEYWYNLTHKWSSVGWGGVLLSQKHESKSEFNSAVGVQNQSL